MIAELILIRKLLEKTPSLGSTPIRGVLPKSFRRNLFGDNKQSQRPKIITTKKAIGPTLGLKKYF